jgi:hypothetical protein
MKRLNLNRKLFVTTAAACALALAACGPETPAGPTDDPLGTALPTTGLETDAPEVMTQPPATLDTGTDEPAATSQPQATAAATDEPESTSVATTAPQDTDEPAGTAVSSPEPRPTLAGTADAQETPGGAVETAMPGTEAPSTEGETVVPSPALLGVDLAGLNGESLGTIVDALVNTEGQVDYIVVELPAAAGGGQVVLPWADLNLDTETSEVMFEGALADLQNAAENFQLPPELEQEVMIRTEGTTLDEQFNNLLRLDALEDLQLGDASSQIANFAGTLVNAQSGQVDYVVLDLSPLLGGTAPAQVIVPWEQFNIDPNATVNENLFALGVTPELLATAPIVDLQNLSQWIDLEAVEWDDQIRSFWEGAGF